MSGTAHLPKSQDGSYRFGFWGSRACCWLVFPHLFYPLDRVDRGGLDLVVLSKLRGIDPLGILAEPLRGPGKTHSG